MGSENIHAHLILYILRLLEISKVGNIEKYVREIKKNLQNSSIDCISPLIYSSHSCLT